MLEEYGADMHSILSTKKDWSCPYKLNACTCQKCGCSKDNYMRTSAEQNGLQ